MSDFANTVQRPATRAGLVDRSARSGKSVSMDKPSRSACWSRKEPVPAAQTEFIEKSPMPSYRDRLTSEELADLVGYLKSLKGQVTQ